MTKTICTILATVTIPASASVPLKWTVETSRVQPAQFDAYHGETLDMEATFLSYGSPLALPADSDCRIFWQTNGMGNVYWSTNAVLVSSNAIAAVFRPTFDPGATTVLGFIGIPASNYRAAFTIRFRGSPGATPFNPPPMPQAEYYTKPEVDSRIASATNAIRRVDGAVRPLPPYLHALDFDDAYPEDAAWYYAQPQDYGQCSSVRDGNSFARNYDWKFDRAAEFVVRMSAGPGRFASVGVANCGTNLTEEIATGGKWSRYFKCLPGRTVDGINENGVVANVNVVSGVPTWQTGDGLHPLAAVRWVLDNATSAASAAQHLAEHIRFPAGWTQNFHWMIADATETWIVENAAAHSVTGRAAMTNFPLYPTRGSGEGQERYDSLMGGSNITSQWWTLTYTPGGYRASDLPGIDSNLVFAAWASKQRESHRGETFGDVAWWQTVHTSVYDITNLTLRVAVQETDDWYAFAVPQGGKVKSVNGKAGDVVLGAADVGALPSTNSGRTFRWNGTALFTDAASIISPSFNAGIIGTSTEYKHKAIQINDGFGAPTYTQNLQLKNGTVALTEDIPILDKALVYDPDGISGQKVSTRDGTHDLSAEDIGALGIYGGTMPSGSLTLKNGGVSFWKTTGYLTTQTEFKEDAIRRKINNTTTATISYPTQTGTLALTSDITAAVDHTDVHFSNEVLAVGLNIDTNSVAQISAILDDLGGVPIEGAATTVGGLLIALAAAVAWLKRNKANTSDFAISGMADYVQTAFSASNSNLTDTIKDVAAPKEDSDGNFYFEVED